MFFLYVTNLHPAFPLFSLISVDKFLRCFTNGVNESYEHQQGEQKHKHISGVLFICLWPVGKIINLSFSSLRLFAGEKTKKIFFTAVCGILNNVSTLSVNGEIFARQFIIRSLIAAIWFSFIVFILLFVN